MALNIKKIQPLPHPDVTSVKLTTKVRGLTLEDSSRGDYVANQTKPQKNTKLIKKENDEEVIPPIKKLDLI